MRDIDRAAASAAPAAIKAQDRASRQLVCVALLVAIALVVLRIVTAL